MTKQRKPTLTWEGPQEDLTYDPLYLANNTFGGLLNLTGSDMNLWSPLIVGNSTRETSDTFAPKRPLTALRTQVYYQNSHFRKAGMFIGNGAIVTDNPIYKASYAMPHKANVYHCHQKLLTHEGLVHTNGTLFPGSRSSLDTGHFPERAVRYSTEVLFLKDEPVASFSISARENNTTIVFDPLLRLEERMIIDNSGNSIHSLGNELLADIVLTQELIHQWMDEKTILYVLKPLNGPVYSIRLHTQNGRTGKLKGRPVLQAESHLEVQVEILPDCHLSENSGRSVPPGHEQLKQEQKTRWATFWSKSTIHLPVEATAWQERYDTSLFYLGQSMVDGPNHPVGISKPMLPYWYGSFHDTDTYFCRPLLEANHPELAARNLEFRYRTLERAHLHGDRTEEKGALYPWQSDPEGNGETHNVPMNQAIIACEAWHQFLHTGNPAAKQKARAITAGIFQNLLHFLDTEADPLCLKESVIPTFSETIDAVRPAEAILALRSTAEAFLALHEDCGHPLKELANRVLEEMPLKKNSFRAWRIGEEEDPEYLRCPSMTLGTWPLRHLPADLTMERSLKYELGRIVSIFAWMPHQFASLASRLQLKNGSFSAQGILAAADHLYKRWHAYDEWENRRTVRAQIFVTAAGGFCTAVHHMLLAETESRTLALFPGIPDDWKDLAFDNLTTPLGWTLSASRKEGKTTALTARRTYPAADPTKISIPAPADSLKIPEGARILKEESAELLLSMK